VPRPAFLDSQFNILDSMKRSPERVAWTILFAALFACCALAVGVPTGALTFVNTATVEAAMAVKLQAGILKTYSQFETENDARVVSLEGRSLSEGSVAVVGSESVGVLIITDTISASPLVTAQLYSNADVQIERARLPRFQSSTNGDNFVFRMRDGRIQVTARPTEGRRFKLRIKGNHAVTDIDTPGVYSLEQRGNETRVIVWDGQALVSTPSGEQSLHLYPGQRTAVSEANSFAGVLPPYRNLIRNGDFQSPLEQDWQVVAQVDASVGSTISGTAKIVGDDANPALLLERTGSNLGWGRTGVTQLLDADVRNSREVRLALDFSVLYQEVPVCGGLGSECPLLVSLIWEDSKGGEHQWVLGFYADGTPRMPELPDFILTNPQSKHIKAWLGQQWRWETGNLLTYLPDAQTIKSMALYAEGHGVRTQLNSVELLKY
jgi:hypothetical protein